MSVIIIGVGNEDYGAMRELDSDGKLLGCQGKTSVRDNVQFVPYRECVMAGDLSSQVLAEVPDQLLEFMAMKGIKPNPKLLL